MKKTTRPRTRGSKVIQAPVLSTEETATRLINHIYDPDMNLQLFPGAPHHNRARENLSSSQLGQIVESLLEDSNHPDERVRWRIGQAITTLRDILQRKTEERQRMERGSQAEFSQTTGIETCECGEVHHFKANYYVSAEDAGRSVLLAGPYKTHAEALHNENLVRQIALKNDPLAAFYSFGTVAMKHSYAKPGILNSYL